MLDPNASHHLLQVLRKKAGESFWIFNGLHLGEFEATLISTGKKSACAKIGAFYERHTESPLKIHLGQAISRGERMDYAIQKSVELGVFEITPLFTEYCQVQLSDHRIEKRVAHWQAIAISAAEQSGRTAVPKIHIPCHFSEWIKQSAELKILCCLEHEAEKNFVSLENATHMMVGIGAEGGFSTQEIQAAQAQHFKFMSLGPRILRTETAPVVALAFLEIMADRRKPK